MSYKDASYINWRSLTSARLTGLPATCQRASIFARQPALEKSSCWHRCALQEFHRWVALHCSESASLR